MIRLAPRQNALGRAARAAFARLGTGLALAFAASAVLAAPDSSDAVARYLQEQHIVEKAVSAQASEQAASDAGAAAMAKADRSLARDLRDRASDWSSDLVLSAMHFLGVPYKRGGQSENGFDCSGFTRHVFEASVGLVLPRRSEEQARFANLLKVEREQLKPGDLVFFNTLKRSFSHVGIYVGDGKFIHAPRTGSEVRVEDMRAAYWAKRFTGARRASGPAVTEAQSAPVTGSTPLSASPLPPAVAQAESARTIPVSSLYSN